MAKTITSEMVEAYSQCPRKAFSLFHEKQTRDSHEYIQLLELRRNKTIDQFIKTLTQKDIKIKQYNPESLKFANDVYLNVSMEISGLTADCDCLRKVEGQSAFGNFCYVPTICIGTYTISKELRIRLMYAAYVLEEIQKTPPSIGQVITYDSKIHKIKLKSFNKTLSPLLKTLKGWAFDQASERPSIFLNKHCLICQFHDACRSKAVEDDHLSLLDRATLKIISKYGKKRIFTVKQLSYVFKPRKRRKDNKRSILIHNIELQALALREKKIFVQTLPTISRQPTELFIDIEGIPDQQFYYLFGLLIKESDTSSFYSFWAESYSEEKETWQRFLDKLNQYANFPIYHYGSFEPRAIAKLAKRYETDIESLKNRLVNVRRPI